MGDIEKLMSDSEAPTCNDSPLCLRARTNYVRSLKMRGKSHMATRRTKTLGNLKTSRALQKYCEAVTGLFTSAQPCRRNEVDFWRVDG